MQTTNDLQYYKDIVAKENNSLIQYKDWNDMQFTLCDQPNELVELMEKASELYTASLKNSLEKIANHERKGQLISEAYGELKHIAKSALK